MDLLLIGEITWHDETGVHEVLVDAQMFKQVVIPADEFWSTRLSVYGEKLRDLLATVGNHRLRSAILLAERLRL